VKGPKVCKRCGSWEGLQVHHKNGNHKDNTPSNLEWLCVNCHSRAHRRFIPERNNSNCGINFHKEHSKETEFRFR
jgi:5-methylcytosine-specific restriction endonuclease McrA